jgi:predicted PurR-regulated permease PerM
MAPDDKTAAQIASDPSSSEGETASEGGAADAPSPKVRNGLSRFEHPEEHVGSRAMNREPTSDEGPLEDDVRRMPPGEISLVIITTLLVLAAFKYASAVMFPVTLALVLHFLLSPLIRLFGRYRVPEFVSATIVVLGAVAAVGVAGYFLSDPASEWISQAPDVLRQAEVKFRGVTEPLEDVAAATEHVGAITTPPGTEEPVTVIERKQPIVDSVLNMTAGAAVSVSTTVVLLYLMLAAGHRTLNSVVELMPTMADKRGVVELVRSIEEGISRYLVTVTLINTGLGVAIGTAMWLLGLPSPVLIGVLAAALNFVPFLGAVAGAAIVFLIALVSLDTTAAILAPVVYATINTIEGNVITPMIVGRSMSLNPVFVFLAIILWGWLWGIGGILIAVPLLGIAKIFCEHFESLRPIARVLEG